MTHSEKPGTEQPNFEQQAPLESQEPLDPEGKDTSAEAAASEADTQAEPQTKSVEVLEAELKQAHEALSTEKDKALRVAAEAENIRRRAAIEVEKATNYALEKFATELLEVIDNLERALQAIDPENAETKAIGEGVEITYKGFMNTVKKFGLEPINPEGEIFNPQHHQAMSMQESTDVPANTVLHVMAKGYSLNGRLLRPAMVMVSRAPTEGVDVEA